MTAHIILLGSLVGILTTATTDLASIIGARLGVGGPARPPVGPPAIIGRWFGYMFRGRFHHANIYQSPSLPGEMPLGLIAHYLIGVVFALAFSWIAIRLHIAQVFIAAVIFGFAMVVFPWFVMQPSQGLGWMGRNVPPPAQPGRMSLFVHFIFGLALAIWVTVLRPF